MVRLGFTRAYGTNLRKIIAVSTQNRFSSFLSGVAVTALLQSSTASILLLTSFAKKHTIPLYASLAVVIGADLSTTLVAQVLSFDLSWLSPALLSIGIVGHMMNEHGGRKRHVSRIFIGLGLMLLSLSLIRSSAAPLQDAEILPLVLAPLNNDPVLAIIFAAIITWVIHSSLAAVLLFASLAVSGVLNAELGILLVLGSNIGGAFIPLIATYKDGAEIRRITTGNLIMRIITLILIIPFIPLITILLTEITSDTSRQIINFHTCFNGLLAIIFLPTISLVAMLSNKLIPDDKKTRSNKLQPLYLNKRAFGTPVIALAGAARETLRISEFIESMLESTIIAFKTDDEKLIKKISKEDNTVDSLYDATKLYMTHLSQEGLDPKEADRYIQILTFATNLEHIGDIIDKSLMEMAKKKIKLQQDFSKEGFLEIQNFHNQVLQNMQLAQAIFISEDPKLAAHLIASKKSIRYAANKTSEKHFKRLQDRKSESIATSSLHLDIIRDYRRINSYITRVAYAILENAKQNENK
ncbi:MAG: Na/Pi cotransporter family protein [Alphaproteobacteria bacterium]|nr:Na/Pi cotransporter family protein [Alphaproteobacteria bacterium]